MAGAIDPHTHIGGGKMTIARMLLPEDHRGDPVTRTELDPRRLRPRRALDSRHRLSLCRDGLHRLLRAGHAAGQCASGAYGDGRHAHGRQRRLRHARLRRLFPAPARGEERLQGDQGLRRLDHALGASHRREGGQSGRHQRLQIQSAQARSRRGARLLPRDAAADHPDARPCGAGARRHAPAAHSRLQSRHSRQYRIDARHGARGRRLAPAHDAYPVPELRHRRGPQIFLGRGASYRARQQDAERLDRRGPGAVRPDLHGIGRTRCANMPSPRARIRRSR